MEVLVGARLWEPEVAREKAGPRHLSVWETAWSLSVGRCVRINTEAGGMLSFQRGSFLHHT